MYGWKQLVQQALSMGRGEQVLEFVNKYSWVVDKDVAQHITNVTGEIVPITWPVAIPVIEEYLSSDEKKKWMQLRNLMASNNFANLPPNYYHVYCELCLNQGQDNQFIETILKHGVVMNPGVIEKLYELYLEKGGIESVKFMMTVKIWDQQVKMMNMLFDPITL